MDTRRLLAIIIVLALPSTFLFAQTFPDFWERISPDKVTLPDSADRQHEPLQCLIFELDYEKIKDFLDGAPREFSPAARQEKMRLVLPLADGKKEVFSIVKTSVMDTALEALHPEIGTYAGKSIHQVGMQVRITITPGWGFQAIITRADMGVEYIEPVAIRQNRFYIVYDRNSLPKDLRAESMPACDEMHQYGKPVDESLSSSVNLGALPAQTDDLLGDPVHLRVYRFACAATGEFSQDNGGTKDLVFQRIVEITNQLNAMFERDLSIRVLLIPEAYDIIFLDPATDPYTGNTIGGWATQNQTVLLQNLGTADKFDIGHVFGRYMGMGPIGAVGGYCCTASKGDGCSAWYGAPYGDGFLAVAAHEMGHQWRAKHTFNHCGANYQYTYDSACEPGSGITLMSYNGSCGSDDNGGSNKALFYHASTIAEVRRFYENQEGATCGTILPTNNTAPMVSTSYPPVVFIPIRTPFELTGSAIDMDGDPITYGWDQIDLGPSCPLGTPSGNAPTFMWREPTSSPSRTFPGITSLINNVSFKTEVLPTYNRDLTFVFTARGNVPGGGGLSWDTVALRSTTLAGPFLVTIPNALGITWKVGENQLITWNVANTNKSPVNAHTVNIKLSKNNGVDYPITLAAGVPNNGKTCIQVPNHVGANNRIRVEAANNVFFDISDFSFSIVQPSPAFSLCASLAKDIACLPDNYITQIGTSAQAGFNGQVLFSATGLPPGAVATFSPNPVQAGSSSTMTISFPSNTVEKLYYITIIGNSGASSSSTPLALTVFDHVFETFSLSAPPNGAPSLNAQPSLYWNLHPDADLYDVELATNPAFLSPAIVASKYDLNIDSFQVPVVLEAGKEYYWRVRPKNGCGTGNWSNTQVFMVAVQLCSVHAAADLPVSFVQFGTPIVESKISIDSSNIVSDVNVKTIKGNYASFKRLELHLLGPSGTDVVLWANKCFGYDGSFNLGMDDGAITPFVCPPSNTGLTYKPESALSQFSGQTSAGIWTLQMKDVAYSGVGSLEGFELEICSNVPVEPPMVLINAPLMLFPGSDAGIGEDLLQATDPNNGPAELIFTLMSLPANGLLQLNGIPAHIGIQFTQSAINNGALHYSDFGLNLGQDNFTFSVTDGAGGLAVDTFIIQPFAVSTQAPDSMQPFDLMPNPTNSALILSFNQALANEAQVTLYNMAGQYVSTWQLAVGTSSLRLDLDKLPKGLYAVSVVSEKAKSVKRFVLQ